MNKIGSIQNMDQTRLRMWPLASAMAAAGLLSVLLGGCSLMDSNKTAAASEVQIRPMPLLAQGTKTPDAYYTLGKYYFYQGRLGQAKAAFLDAIKLDPHHVDALNGLGVIYDREGSYDAARKSYEAALLKDPQAAHVWANLGYSLILAGKNAESIVPLQKAVALDPANAIAQQHLAAVKALETPAVASAEVRPPELATASAAPPALLAPANPGPVASVVTAKGIASAEAKPLARATPAVIPGLKTTVTSSVAAPSKPAQEVAMRPPEAQPAPPSLPQALEPLHQPQPVIASVIRQPASDAGVIKQAPATMSGPAKAWAEPSASKVAVVVHPAVVEIKTKPPVSRSESVQGGRLNGLRIEVSNGNGVAGMARAVGTGMRHNGLNVARITNARPFNKPQTLIVCRPDLKAAAAELAETMPAKPKIVLQDTAHRHVDVRVVLGVDSALAWKEGPVGSNKVAGLSR